MVARIGSFVPYAIGFGFLFTTGVSGFLVHPQLKIPQSSSACARPLTALGARPVKMPTEEQLREDPFLAQISYTPALLQAMADKERKEEVTELLKAQFSHYDGMRGFFISFLTAVTDFQNLPLPLGLAIDSIKNKGALAQVSVQNVVTASAAEVDNDEDPQQQAKNKMTAKNGKVMLSILCRGKTNKKLIQANCRAVFRVCGGKDLDKKVAANNRNVKKSSLGRGGKKKGGGGGGGFGKQTESSNINKVKVDGERIDYWSKFIDEQEFERNQRTAIAKAVERFL